MSSNSNNQPGRSARPPETDKDKLIDAAYENAMGALRHLGRLIEEDKRNRDRARPAKDDDGERRR